MNDSNNHCTIDLQTLSQYQQHLYEQEKSHPTIQSYLRSLKAFAVFLDGRPYTKETAIRWKETLTSRYAPNTVNAMLAAINGFAEFSGCPQFKVKPLKIQRELFIRPERELTQPTAVGTADYPWCSRPSAPPESGYPNCALSPQRRWKRDMPRWTAKANGALFSCRKSCAV